MRYKFTQVLSTTTIKQHTRWGCRRYTIVEIDRTGGRYHVKPIKGKLARAMIANGASLVLTD